MRPARRRLAKQCDWLVFVLYEEGIMINIDKIKNEIIEKLRPLNPDKIILFGSYAYGSPNEESDIDLYVVTQDDFIPQTYQEKMNIKLKVAKTLRDLQKTIPIDVITHTRKMHTKFLQLNSSFSREIMQKGILLYG